MGGFAMYVLLLCSIISFAVMIERLFYYSRRSQIRLEEFMDHIREFLKKGNIKSAQEYCEQGRAPFVNVVRAALDASHKSEQEITNATERQIAIEIRKLEKYTAIVGTIGSIAVYIGLFGTVLGIIRVFHDIAANSSGATNVVIGGIAEALVCTAAGLCVSIPAVVTYNYFTKRIDGFITDMELCASEINELVGVTHK